ncbi:hypothetical protein Tco_0347553 [Tanacetum coccineum]
MAVEQVAVEQVAVEQVMRWSSRSVVEQSSDGGGAVEQWWWSSRSVVEQSSGGGRAVEQWWWSSRAVIGEQWWRVVVEQSSDFGGIVTSDGDGIFERKEKEIKMRARYGAAKASQRREA